MTHNVSGPSDNRRRNNLPWPASEERRRPTGRVSFDDRGNAVFEWANPHLAREGDDADRARSRALDNPTFSLVEDEPKPGVPIRENKKGLRVGYNPYESGLLNEKPKRKKTDLRALSAWIEQRRLVGSNDDEAQ
jgi:hypothetical protein